jgi:tricorn protease-like protein
MTIPAAFRLARWTLALGLAAAFALPAPPGGRAARGDDGDDPVAELVRALGDESPLVRKRAAIALGRLGPHGAAVPALRKALDDPDPEVRAAAAAALRTLGGPLSREELLHRLRDRKQGAAARVAACRELADRFADDPDVPRALEGLLADPAVKLEAARALEAIEKRVRLGRVTRGMTLKGHTGPLTAVAFSPDGRTLATAAGEPGAPGEIKLWEVATGRERLSLRGHVDLVTALAFSPDGAVLASAGGVPGRKGEGWAAGEVKLWEADTGRERSAFQGHAGLITGLAFSPDGKRLATASEDHTAVLWDVAGAREAATLKGHAAGLTAVAFSPGGKLLATAARDRTVRLWEGAGKERLVLKGHPGPVTCVAFAPDGRTLAAGGGAFEAGQWTSGEARLWDVASGTERLTVGGHTDAVAAVAFAPEGRVLATGSWDSTVRLWDAGGGQELKSLVGHTSRVTAVAFSPDGKLLATASEDRTAKLWQVTWERAGRGP